MHVVEGQYHIALYYIEDVKPKDIYYYKDKPYCIMEQHKRKVNGEWESCITYQCLYENPDGMIWNRKTEEFFELFKKKDQ